MSRIIKHLETPTQMTSVVQTSDGLTYCIDTRNTFDVGIETMIFPYILKKNRITNWNGLYSKRFKDYQSAFENHKAIILNTEDYL